MGNSPEVSLVIVDSVEQAIELFNDHSPQFVASLISEDDSEHASFTNLLMPLLSVMDSTLG